jgi:hypothetical protein
VAVEVENMIFRQDGQLLMLMVEMVAEVEEAERVMNLFLDQITQVVVAVAVQEAVVLQILMEIMVVQELLFFVWQTQIIQPQLQEVQQ